MKYIDMREALRQVRESTCPKCEGEECQCPTTLEVTNADKMINTTAYQNYKAGDEHYHPAEDLEEQKRQLEEEIAFLSEMRDTMIQEKIQQGFAVRFFDPSNGKRFAAAYPNKKDAQDKAAQLKKDGLKETINRVPQKWFVEGDKAKYYYFCENAVKNISIETADNALIAMKNWRGYENLKNIKQDTLIIWGDKDTSYNFNQVDTLKKNISISQLEIFKGCGHNAHLEEPQKFNETVKNFLS